MDPKRNQQLRQMRDKLDRRSAKASIKQDCDLTPAIDAFKRNDFDRCLQQCNLIIESDPSLIAAYMLKGRAYLAKGNNTEAIHVLKSAIDLGIDDANLWCELGNLYAENNDPENAINAWQSSIQKDEKCHIARKNLGFAFFAEGQWPLAEKYLKESLRQEPLDLTVIRTLSSLWSKQNNFQSAADLLERSLTEYPNEVSIYKLLSSIYRSASDFEKYQSTLRRWLVIDPENAVVQHLLAGTLHDNTSAPGRASDQYIRDVFNQFAETFDADLQQLRYEAPVHVANAVQNIFGNPGEQIRPMQTVLDAGCGTGICGPFLRPYARSLIGVDLSDQMIKIAQDRHCYDRLEVVELTMYLLKNENAFNAIVGCDTFNYFGDLCEIFRACRYALKDQGLLFITLEHASQSDDSDYRLNLNGRYTHNQSYVTKVASETSLSIIDVHSVNLRQEADQPVQGLVVILQK